MPPPRPPRRRRRPAARPTARRDRKSTRLNSSHLVISYAVFCLKKKNNHVRRNLPFYLRNCQYPDFIAYIHIYHTLYTNPSRYQYTLYPTLTRTHRRSVLHTTTV